MSYGICHLSIVPLRAEPSDVSEMVSQVLFGEHLTVLEKTKKWSKIRVHFDGYEGFIDNKQFLEIGENDFDRLSKSEFHYSSEIVNYVTDSGNYLSTISIGSRLPFLEDHRFKITDRALYYEGATFQGILSKKEIVYKAFLFLNTIQKIKLLFLKINLII